MSGFFFIVLIAFVVLILLLLIRVFKGPTIYDSLNGLGLIGVIVIIMLVLIGFITKREDMYLDIAMSFSILGFVGSIIIARFLFEQEGKKDR